jgi:AAA15 family ATPase/GTPase
MIKALEIKNFRCFKDLYLRDLKRFNLIVGESGSGKTSLLEAIFLVAGASPEVWMRLRNWRGFSPIFRLSGTRASYESLFRDIFYNFDKRKPASIRLVGSDDKARSLKISYPNQEKYSTRGSPPQDQEGQENAYLVEPIVFNWKSKGREQKARVDFKDGVLRFSGFNDVYPVWFMSPAINEAGGVAQLYSELSLKKKSGSLANIVSSLFPFVHDLSVESIAGELALCASVESMSEKLPIGTISSGLTHFVSTMVAIASNPGGVILMDEIEVGFYYANLSGLLEVIFSSCEEHDVQLVASTHSYEFLSMLLPMMTKRIGTENEFALLRAQRTGTESSIKLLGDPSAAIASNFELR